MYTKPFCTDQISACKCGRNHNPNVYITWEQAKLWGEKHVLELKDVHEVRDYEVYSGNIYHPFVVKLPNSTWMCNFPVPLRRANLFCGQSGAICGEIRMASKTFYYMPTRDCINEKEHEWTNIRFASGGARIDRVEKAFNILRNMCLQLQQNKRVDVEAAIAQLEQ